MSCRLLRSLALAAILGAGAFGTTWAQEGPITETYGRGVHAFFAGDYFKAHELLSLAVDSGSQDPRAYYFRGLCNAHTGREEEAKVDWRQAAEMEYKGQSSVGVGRALLRIQGEPRLQLEAIRHQVRLELRNQTDANAQQRYEQGEAVQPSVTRDLEKTPLPPATASGSNPFAKDDDGTPAEVSDAAPGSDDPAAGDAPAADTPAGEDGANPFEDDAGAAAKEGDAATETDPFAN
jgi:hypothetical protein